MDITGCPFLKILVNHPSDIQLIILIHIINRWGYPEYWLASKYSYYGQLWVIIVPDPDTPVCVTPDINPSTKVC
jgi:hypothetical protein